MDSKFMQPGATPGLPAINEVEELFWKQACSFTEVMQAENIMMKIGRQRYQRFFPRGFLNCQMGHLHLGAGVGDLYQMSKGVYRVRLGLKRG